VSEAAAPFLSRRFVSERVQHLGRLAWLRWDDATALSTTRFVGRYVELDEIGRRVV